MERLTMDRRRFERAHLKYAVLRLIDKYPTWFTPLAPAAI